MKKFILLLSAFALFLFFNLDDKNKNFDTSGSLFTSNIKNKATKNKHIVLSNEYWTSGRFNF